MAPKRTGKVLKTTKKVVEETVEVVAVGGDSQNSVEVPAGDSKFVEVVVEAKEARLPIAVVTTTTSRSDQKAGEDAAAGKGKEAETKRKKQRGEEEPSEEKEAEPPVSEKSIPQQEAEPQGKQQREEEEPRKEREAEPPISEKSKAPQEEAADKGKKAESIADKETLEQEEEEEKLADKDKQAEPQTPKKLEQPPQRDEEKQKEAVKEPEAEKGRKTREGGSEGKRRRRKKRFSGGGEMDGVGRGYKRYVFRVLKQVHPGLAISSRAMAVLDGMMGDMFERLADEASRLSTYAGKATLSSSEIQGAVQLVLPGELGKHAISEGTKAVTNYMAADRGD